MAKKKSTGEEQELTGEQESMAAELGLTLKELLEALRNSPVLKMIVLQLLENFFKVRGKGATVSVSDMPKGSKGHCDHLECCRQVMLSALCTAHCATEHYLQAEEEGGHVHSESTGSEEEKSE